MTHARTLPEPERVEEAQRRRRRFGAIGSAQRMRGTGPVRGARTSTGCLLRPSGSTASPASKRNVKAMQPPSATTWTFFEGDWHPGNLRIMGVRTHGAWLGSTVFDGARAFEGVVPDLDLHLGRVNQSAANFGLKPAVPVETWRGLVMDGLKRFDKAAELYIRP